MPKYKPEPMVQIAVRVPAWLRDSIDAEAERQRRKFSDIVRIALEEYMRQKQER